MTWRTNKIIIMFRQVGRYLGINWVIQKWLYGQLGYEEKFGRLLLKSIHLGDTVWDVGANVGFYSAQFAVSVGSSGRVYAFEPSPETLRLLEEQIKLHDNVIVVPYALGGRNSKAFLKQSIGDKGGTSRVIEKKEISQDKGLYEIQVWTGDRYVDLGKSPIPNLVKIDAEGAEVEILEGMENILSSQELRAIFMEVHFSVLQERGLAKAPAEMEKKLISKGFHVEWVDFSHLVAQKKKQ